MPNPTTNERRIPTSYTLPLKTRRLIAARAKTWRRSQSSYLEELVHAEAGKSSMIPLAPRTYTPTAHEKRAIEKGRAEIARGDYYTLDEFRHFLLGSSHPKEREKKVRTRTAPRARAHRDRA